MEKTLLAEKLSKLGLTQKQIGDRVGVSQAFVSTVLKNRILNFEAASKFTDEFEFDIVEIMEDFDSRREKRGYNKRPKEEYNLSSLKIVKCAIISKDEAQVLKDAYFDPALINKLRTEEITTTQHTKDKFFKIEVWDERMVDKSLRGLWPGDWAYCKIIERLDWRTEIDHNFKYWCFFHNEHGIIFSSIQDYNPNTGELILEALNSDRDKFPVIHTNIGLCSYISKVIKKLTPL